MKIKHAMRNKHLLDSNVRERQAKQKSAGPPILGESCQGCAVADHQQHLGHENRLRQLRVGVSCHIGPLSTDSKNEFKSSPM